MSHGVFSDVVCAAGCAAVLLSGAEAFGQRQTLFNDGWSFSLLDSVGMPTTAQPERVTLPHDWSVRLAPFAEAPMGNDGGYYPAGKALYEKRFTASNAWRGRRNLLHFEGVYMNASVVLNGIELGFHAYGWTPFEVDITNALRYDAENVLRVCVDNSLQRNCRWYTGSGIYRNVWLKSLPVDGAIGGYAVRTRKTGVDYLLDVDCRAKVTAELTDALGAVVAGGTLPLKVQAPKEWSPKTPYLYTLRLATETDTVRTHIGFRTIEYSAENGLRLNGEPILLSGACVHHDNGPLGACAYAGAEVRRVALLKRAGFNAVRTSHNPPSTAFLDACDSLGLLVVDEIFDGWRASKTPHDYSTLFDSDWQSDVDAWVSRDVNHPSVWCWSVGNEVIERTDPECVMTARKLVGRVHSLDPYRPVTSAMCSWNQGWARFDSLMAQHDICGYNYYLHEAQNDHARVPSRVIMQTESFPRDAVKNYHTVSDMECVIGDFVWTGIDYLGESGIGRFYYDGQTPGEHYHRPQWPWHGAYCGDIDIIGWRKPISYLRDMLYNPDNNGIYLAVREPDGYNGTIKETQWSVWPTWPRWTWKGWEGKPIDVEVYTCAKTVRLYLNNKLVGEQDVVDRTAKFTLKYAPGTLKAEAVTDGKTTKTVSLRTAGKPSEIKLLTEVYDDLTYVTATVVDSHGVPVASDCELTFSVEGTELLATASADLTDKVVYTSPVRKTWNGMALAIVRTKAGAKIKVEAKGLKSRHL